jgi:hypothetical protein
MELIYKARDILTPDEAILIKLNELIIHHYSCELKIQRIELNLVKFCYLENLSFCSHHHLINALSPNLHCFQYQL